MIFNMTSVAAGAVKTIHANSAEALPTSAAEGTLAIISQTRPVKVLVQNTEPTAPDAGDVWVSTGVTSTAPVQTGNITVYPTSAKQYDGSAWVTVSTYVFSNGAWMSLEMYLFQSGDQNESVTGGWLAAWQMAGVAAIGDAALEAAYGTANQEYNRVAFCTKDTVDLSAYKTLRASFVQTRQHTRTNIAVGVTSTPFAEGKLAGDRETVINTPELCMNGYTNITTKQTSAFTLEYDISALTDSMHVVVYFGSVECICTSVQLVP